jgi:hypothetical protein
MFIFWRIYFDNFSKAVSRALAKDGVVLGLLAEFPGGF